MTGGTFSGTASIDILPSVIPIYSGGDADEERTFYGCAGTFFVNFARGNVLVVSVPGGKMNANLTFKLRESHFNLIICLNPEVSWRLRFSDDSLLIGCFCSFKGLHFFPHYF